eukprot:188672-Pyramimonas_sp.AAC.2
MVVLQAEFATGGLMTSTTNGPSLEVLLQAGAHAARPGALEWVVGVQSDRVTLRLHRACTASTSEGRV